MLKISPEIEAVFREQVARTDPMRARLRRVRPARICLIAFEDIKLGTERSYLVKGLIPHVLASRWSGDRQSAAKASGHLTS